LAFYTHCVYDHEDKKREKVKEEEEDTRRGRKWTTRPPSLAATMITIPSHPLFKTRIRHLGQNRYGK
jgi:hypothetical protein